ncbi:TetR/AcrR family transcriptional regulator [Streptomyces sp. NPDC004539]|uniref:TetR/AcrR family transcriptional regulator n=1 Tax=Streptomyces sp. NPDC004539 TaxID=3154280 RepID=UPI0033AEBE43
MTQETAAAKRGRPRTIDPNAIVDTATRLMHRQGYADTTMMEIADACGISRKSLFLYFPAKSDLIWATFDGYVEGLRKNITNSDAADPLDKVIDAVIVGFDLFPLRPDIMRLQVQMIGTDSELRQQGESRSLSWRDAVADCLVRRTGNRPLADGLAYGVWRCLWKGLHLWADTSLPSPLPLVQVQLDQFARAVNEPTGMPTEHDKRS